MINKINRHSEINQMHWIDQVISKNKVFWLICTRKRSISLLLSERRKITWLDSSKINSKALTNLQIMKLEHWQETLNNWITKKITQGKTELIPGRNLKWKLKFTKINKLQKEIKGRSWLKSKGSKIMKLHIKWLKISKNKRSKRKLTRLTRIKLT